LKVPRPAQSEPGEGGCALDVSERQSGKVEPTETEEEAFTLGPELFCGKIWSWGCGIALSSSLETLWTAMRWQNLREKGLSCGEKVFFSDAESFPIGKVLAAKAEGFSA
jgi:hypothetical protein